MNPMATCATSHLRRRLSLLLVAVALCLASIAADARQPGSGDLKVFTTRAIATVLEKIGSDVERYTGRKLTVTTDVAIRLVRRVKAGEAFDLLVAAPGQIEELVADGMIVRETRTIPPARASALLFAAVRRNRTSAPFWGLPGR